MADQGVRIEVSRRKDKKYDAILPDGRRVPFGDKRYEQWKDTTPLKAFSHLDHGDPKRRASYFARHGRDAEKHSAKYFASKYLWGG